MSLDVYVQPNPEMPRLGGDYEHVCFFIDDEGYYWFLYPLFDKLHEETGQFIDLYGGAVFKGSALDALVRTLAEARGLLQTQPENWEEITGVITEPIRQETHATVDKKQMEVLLMKLEEATDKAKRADAYVTFWGD